MSIDPGLAARLEQALDLDEAVAFLRAAVGTPSVTGEEASFARLLHTELSRLGFQNVELHDFLPGRPNVWGLRPGHGNGPRILLIGHTDTVHVRGWKERWARSDRVDPFAAPIIDGQLWGRGAADLKAGICTALMSLRVLDKARQTLAGDVLCAFVGDEESGEPGTGVSAGMKSFVTAMRKGEVPRPDFAIYVEPTTLDIYTAQIGFFIADILLTGRSAYFGVPELGIDAVKSAHAVLTALWNHSHDLEASLSHPLVGSSFLLVTSITGGGYIAVPGECRISLIRKLRPGEDLDQARNILESTVKSAIQGTGIHLDMSYPAGRDHPIGGTPCETDPKNGNVTRLSQCLQAFSPDKGKIAGAPYWSEAPFLATNLGIPTVYCAPGDIRICHTLEECVPIDEYRQGILGFAAFLAGGGLDSPR